MEDNGVKCKDLKSLSIHFLQRNQSVYEIYLFEIKIFYVSMVVKGNLKQTKLNYSQYFECFKYCRKIPLWLNGQGVKRNKYALAINFQIYLWISLGPRCSIIPDYDDCGDCIWLSSSSWLNCGMTINSLLTVRKRGEKVNQYVKLMEENI